MNFFGFSFTSSFRGYGKRPVRHFDLYKNDGGWYFLEVGSFTLEADYNRAAPLPFEPRSKTAAIAGMVTVASLTTESILVAGCLSAVCWLAYWVSFRARKRAGGGPKGIAFKSTGFTSLTQPGDLT
jgi:hypothetical protein